MPEDEGLQARIHWLGLVDFLKWLRLVIAT